MKHRYFCIFASLVLSACQSHQMIDMRGTTDQQFLDELMQKNAPYATITVSSGGGNISSAYFATKSLIDNNNKIVVSSHCLSSCAEYLLAAANEIQFLHSPIIGYHWNTFMNLEQMQRYGGDMSKCDLTSVNQQREIYRHNKLNVDFWKETEKRLNLKYFEVVNISKECPSKKRVFENHMWFPTSTQLEDILGLNFHGGVCADSPKICKRRIDRRWKKGTRLVIGDDVYISKGGNL